MKAKFSLVSVSILLVLSVAILAGCNKSRGDAQIASDVQNKILSDSAIQSRQITVNANKGVVTLSGYVQSDAERAAAAQDAAQIEGVKTVVNNLQPSAQNAANQPPQEQQAEPQQPEKQAQQPERAMRPRHGARPYPPVSHESAPQANTRASNAPTSDTTTAYNATPQPPQNTAPVPPPPPAKITIPDGTTFSVRLSQPLDSERNQVGDKFQGTLDSPVVVGENIAIPTGAEVQGRVVDVKAAGRMAGNSTLAVELTQVSYNGHTYPIHTNTYARSAAGKGKSTAGKIGGGAALGAIIGGLAGGGKGAAIGATVGAGAGTGVSAAGHGQQIRYNTEQVLNFTLQSPITVTPSSERQRGGRKLPVPSDDQQ